MNVLYANFLVNVLLKSYFEDYRCLMILTDSNSFDYNANIPKVIIKDAGEINPDSVFKHYGCQGIIISTKNPIQTFTDFEAKIRYQYKERFNFRRYLFIPHEEYEGGMTELFQQKEIDFVSDVLFVEPVENDTFLLKTHSYTGKHDYDKIVLLDTWFGKNKSFLLGNNLYPEKISNQNGREFRIGTINYEPYSVVGDSLERLHGSELTVALQYALHHNMTPVLVVNKNEYWGDIYENWTGTGIFGNLIMDKADVGFAGLAPWDYHYKFLDLTMPAVRTGVTCLVPSPKLTAGWLTPIYSYNAELWLAVSLVFIFNIIVLATALYWYRNFDKIEASLITIFGQSLFQTAKIFLTQGLDEKTELPPKFSGKLIMMLQFIFVVFLSSTYGSGLSSIMTIPRYEKPIDSVDDINSHDLKWGALEEAWITSIEQATEPNMVKVVSLFNAIPYEQLRELSKTDHFGFAIERLPKENFGIEPYVQEDVIQKYHLMKEDVYWTHIVMMMRKNSILLPGYNQFILTALQADLVSVWQNNATALFMNPTVQKAVKYNDYRTNDGVVKLKWTHVEGAFGILILGYILSFLAFLGEIFYHRLTTKVLVQKARN